METREQHISVFSRNFCFEENDWDLQNLSITTIIYEKLSSLTGRSWQKVGTIVLGNFFQIFIVGQGIFTIINLPKKLVII